MSEDPRKTELIKKVAAYCEAEWGGDMSMLFRATDADRDGQISVGELLLLLSKCGVAKNVTRSAWARAVVRELDSDNDGMISGAEFLGVLSPPT